ncbi:hypothetical protein SAMN05444274_11110 [Mariniphaga anaerophila]|uniref:Uncharacterized protein n=1 Tax=Mariniphaga anaerophila TaxID=1484053 RepID=A0A1M5F445_9BACT|nr:hypothetical protein [Mariniphaga anaerophila]SHF86297.1 hypothetical protein SAMN05444274_11110 [Mariniphaga anaerophila]
MSQDTILYTIPQWFVFAAIIASVYGWVEHKKTFRLLGPVIFFFLGIFSLYSLLSGSFSAHDFLTPAEIISEEMEEETMEGIPFVARLLPAYIAFLTTGLLAIPAFLLELKDKKGKNLFIILTALAGLAGFFVIVGALKSL